VIRTRLPDLRTLPSTTYRTPSSRATFFTSTACPLNLNEVLRDMTNNSRKRERSVRMSSVRPSAKNSCSAAPLMLTNGSTMIDGFSEWNASGAPEAVDSFDAARLSACRRYVRTGSAMFLTVCAPWSSKLAPTFPLTAIRTESETVIPPGSARPSRRDAILTPSPYTVPSAFSIRSPRCTPMRNRMRRSSGAASAKGPICAWIASAADTAPVAVSKTASTESPAMSMTRPWLDSIWARNTARAASSAATVDRSSVDIRREYPTASAARIAASRCFSSVPTIGISLSRPVDDRSYADPDWV